MFHKKKYKYPVLGRHKYNFEKHHSDSTKNMTESDIIKRLEFLIDNMFAMIKGRVFQQTVRIPMGTYCARLLADFIRTKQTLYWGFSRKRKDTSTTH